MVDLALQVTLVVLLLMTITWCVIVHHRLRRLRADRGEMAAFITALGEATDRAERAVRQMHDANRAVEATAQEQQQRTRQQGEDLARLMDNAIRVMKRLDAAVEQGATQVATLRTRAAIAAPTAVGEFTIGGDERRRRPTAAELAGRPPPAPSGVAAATAIRQVVPPVRREGRLGGLLHGELLEALEGLR
jgi:hypothetical protein